MMRHIGVLLVAIGIAAAPARADSLREMAPAASEHLEQGLRYYATQTYDRAIAEFRAGYHIDPHPDFLYAIAQAERLRGNCEAAVGAYRAYLRARPPDREAQLARKNLALCESALAAARTRQPEPSVVSVDRARGWWRDPVTWVLGGAGTVGLGAGATFLIAGNRTAREANRSETLDDRVQLADQASRERLIGGIAIGAGASLLGAVGLRWLFRSSNVAVSAGATADSGQIWIAVEL